uniref:INO80 complex subunit F domain-containing protein n=1 Tax=Lepisosteus oculatus TaxID=7918 RepID=W5LV53_LEPOC
ERDRRKYQALSRRCKELEQVNERILSRLHQVCRLTRRLKKERRFLMKTLTSYGDDFRSAQLTLLLEVRGRSQCDEEEGGALADSAHGGEEEGLHEPSGSSPSSVLQPAAGPRKKRHRGARERDRELQSLPLPLQAEPQFSGYPSPPDFS